MPDGMTLIELVTGLVRDPAERAEFHSDPTGCLAASGNSDAGAEDIQDALTLVDERVADIGHVPPNPAPHPGEGNHELAARFLDTVVTNTFPSQAAHPVVADDDIDEVPAAASVRDVVDGLDDGGPDPGVTHGDTG